MGKVVTIPKDRNPFIVIVNGVEYKYPAGATIEVPDSVADVIEKYEGAKPKPDPTPTPGGGSGGSVQSDWNQNDSSAADFIKNKPFGDELTEIMPETELTGVCEDGMYMTYLDASLFSGTESQLIVTFDGIAYTCNVFDSDDGFSCFGNAKYLGGEDTGEPFVLALVLAYGVAMMAMPDENPHMVSICGMGIVKLNKKYVNATTSFYVSEADNYLYTDVNLTTKATKVQLGIARKQGTVYVSFAADGFEIGAVYCPSYIYTLVSLPYGYVAVLRNGEDKNFYTAEYTPET